MNNQENRKTIKQRFDNETDKWMLYEKKQCRDIIGWEARQRKNITVDYLKKKFGEKKINILEIGCGAGDNIYKILKLKKNWKIKGVDISSEMISICRKRFAGKKKATFEVLDIEKGELKEKFDVIILMGVIGYTLSLENTFSNIDSMLDKNGELIFTYGNKYSIFRQIRVFLLAMARIMPIRNLLGLIYRKKLEPVYPGKGVFNLYSFEDIKKAISKKYKKIAFFNLCFSIGLLGRFSVLQSEFFENLFLRHNFMNLAMTRLLIYKKDE